MKCSNCGNKIPEEKLRRNSLTCSTQCAKEREDGIYKELNPAPTIPSGTRGAVSELRACVDLMERGFEVFHSVSPDSSCDLAVLKDDRLLRVEVRTGHYKRSGGYSYPGKVRADMLAVVLHDQIVYEPPLEAI